MALKKEDAKEIAHALEYEERDLQQVLLLAGWPQTLIDEFMLKNQRKFKKLQIRPESALVTIEGISKKFNDNSVIENVSLKIIPGELLGIIGLSGAGKTTLLNLLVGFSKPDQGHVSLKLPDGTITSVKKDSSLVKAMFGFSAQTPSFYSKLTVKENLKHFGSLYGIPETELIPKIKELLNFVGLTKAQNVVAHNLSGGMQKRLDIACAMIHEPRILILDEPTADLDPLLRKQMWALIKQINNTGTTVIVASHFVDEIESYCKRVAVLGNKRIYQVGTPDELIDEYARNYEIEIETKDKDYSVLTRSLARLKVVNNYVKKDDGVVVYTDYPDKMLEWVAKYCHKNKEKIKKLNLSRPSLSEIFESIVAK